MSIHSNAVLTAINAIQHWEYYPEDKTFLREVAFPLCRDALAFYQCWMRRSPHPSSDGSALNRTDGGESGEGAGLFLYWANERDQSHECLPPSPSSEARKDEFCYQNNSVLASGLIRRVASVLPRMAKQIGASIDSQWQEIADHLLPAPTVQLPDGLGEVFVLAGNTTKAPVAIPSRPQPSATSSTPVTGTNWTAWCSNVQNCGTFHCDPCQPQPAGTQNIATWQVRNLVKLTYLSGNHATQPSSLKKNKQACTHKRTREGGGGERVTERVERERERKKRERMHAHDRERRDDASESFFPTFM